MSRPSTRAQGQLETVDRQAPSQKTPRVQRSVDGGGVFPGQWAAVENMRSGVWGWELSDHFKTQRQAMEMALVFLGTRKALEH